MFLVKDERKLFFFGFFCEVKNKWKKINNICANYLLR